MAQFGGSDVRTTVQIVGPLSVVEPALADHAEAVVREAASNAVRHGGATELSVLITVDDDLSIEVTDNGCGIGENVTPSGLTNLRHRAEDSGGTFSVAKSGARGTVLRWSAPLP